MSFDEIVLELAPKEWGEPVFDTISTGLEDKGFETARRAQWFPEGRTPIHVYVNDWALTTLALRKYLEYSIGDLKQRWLDTGGKLS